MWLLSLLVSAALAGVGLVHESGQVVEAKTAEVLFEQAEDGLVTVTYKMVYRGEAEHVGWIVPIPGQFVLVEDADPTIFDGFRTASEPLVERVADEGGVATGGAGCVRGASDPEPEAPMDTDSVEVVIPAQAFAGDWDFVVVPAGESDALVEWLAQNDWTYGDFGPAIGHYINAGWSFVAIRVHPDEAATPDYGRELPPIRLQYRGAPMVYPAVMALYGPADIQYTTLYARLGERAGMTEGWTATDLVQLVGGWSDDPEGLLDEQLRKLGEQSQYGVTFAAPTDDGFVTRFDTIAPRDAHVYDAVIEPMGTSSEVHTTVLLYESSQAGASWLLLPILALGAGLRRRRG